MNEIRTQIMLSDAMDSREGWGREQGREVFQQLLRLVEANPGKVTFIISLDGITRCDMSFASETIVELARRYRSNKGFCLVNIANEDLVENWDAAARKKEQPLMFWEQKGCRILGPEPSPGNAATFLYMLTKLSATASEIANELDLQISNASTKLKQLWEQGYLLRRQESAESGGLEFKYFVIK